MRYFEGGERFEAIYRFASLLPIDEGLFEQCHEVIGKYCGLLGRLMLDDDLLRRFATASVPVPSHRIC